MFGLAFKVCGQPVLPLCHTAPEDFITENITHDVPVNSMDDVCTNIETQEDNRFEPSESLSVNIINSDIPLCSVSSGTVNIIDSTCTHE